MKSDLDVKLTLWSGLLIFVGIVLINLGGKDLADSIFSFISQAVLITSLARYAFVKWIWKWNCLSWLERFHNVPNLEGKWTGTYESSGNDKTPADKLIGKADVEIIQPSIHKIKIIRSSDESISRSMGEDISETDDGFYYLTYSYLSEPKATVRDRSAISYGSARLAMRKTDRNKIEGNYWTDQKTIGVISLSRT